MTATQASTEGPAEEDLLAARRAQVLYVDDDASVVSAFTRELRRFHIPVEGCLSAQEALDRARCREFSVVATDLRMPAMDGLQLVERLGTLSPRTGFVLVTGVPDLELPGKDADGVTFAGVLRKPWTSGSLVSSIARAQTLFEERSATVSLYPEAIDEDTGPLETILLLEDNPADEALVRAYLKRSALADLPILRCNRLAEAVELAAEHRFGVMLADLSLPDARGLDSIVALRKAAPSTPVVVLSAVDDEALAVKSVQEGAQEYLLKSDLSVTTLQRALRRAVYRKAAAEELAYKAEHDELTALANRAGFQQQLERRIAESKRDGKALALLYLDLDHFKEVNDELGHEAGDHMLCEAARRLQSSIRDRDTCGRLGGDEFAVVLSGLPDNRQAVTFAERILSAFAAPLTIGGRTCALSASIGIALYPQDADDPGALTRAADQAMYRAKHSGRAAYACYRDQSQNDLQTLARYESQLQEDWRGQRLLSQRIPMLTYPDGEPLGQEVTARWEGAPDTTPDQLMNLIASAHLERPVAAWLLERACEHAATTTDHVLTHVSPSLLMQRGFMDALCHAVARHGLSPERLSLLVPHALAASNLDRCQTEVARLHGAGFRTYLTNFGETGADLEALRRLRPLAGVILSPTWLLQLQHDPAGQVLLEAVHVAAAGLDMHLAVRRDGPVLTNGQLADRIPRR